jgi:hypothetical protein
MSELARDTRGHPIECLRPATSRNLTITGTSQQVPTPLSTTVALRLWTDTKCFYRVGANPTANLNDTPLFPGVEIIRINPGETVAVVGTSGNFNVTELV